MGVREADMSELSGRNFGLLIAYIVPGFVVLWGLSYFSATVSSWIGVSHNGSPTVAGFLYVTVASLAAGLVASAVRWALVDTLHHATGVSPPAWRLENLDARLGGFLALAENHYRYYQFYANLLVATAFTYRAKLIFQGRTFWEDGPTAIWFLLFEAILFLGSRDTLQKYYRRAECLLTDSQPPGMKGPTMTNGFHKRTEEVTKPSGNKAGTPKKASNKASKKTRRKRP